MTCDSLTTEAYRHATECYPEECCGLLLDIKGVHTYWKCENVSKSYKEKSFVINPLDWAEGEDQGEVLGIVHSHPDGLLEFSHTDKISCKYNDLPFFLVDPKTESYIELKPEEVDD